MVDSGATVSVFPVSRGSRNSIDPEVELFAANGTKILTYGKRVLSLDFGMSRTFKWTFVIADVARPILGADFLERFALSLDIKNRRLIDTTTSEIICGSRIIRQASGITTVRGNSVYHELLKKYPNLTNPSTNVVIKPQGVTHCILTKGPPVFSRPRRLSADKLAAVKKKTIFGFSRPGNLPTFK